MKYIPTIGLEVHVQLNTKSKLFTSTNSQFGDAPNTNTSILCQALPGTLPVLNKKALEKAFLAGLALGCDLQKYSKFDRKNYFYPDLPKGYQISQYDKPICLNGSIKIHINKGKNKSEGTTKIIPLERIHLEEDAGKLIHSEDPTIQESYVDLNRAGTPLIEVVSKPSIDSSEEAYLYLVELKKIMKYIEVSDCNMEQGSLRCDANISVRPTHSDTLGTRVEIKNLNSFKAVKAAIDYEIERQSDVLDQGGVIQQQTRLWNATTGDTMPMRSKEDAQDYKYFPDPDLTPIILTDDFIHKIKQSLPELAHQKKERFIKDYDIPEYDADVLTQERDVADYYESTVKNNINPKKASNWIMAEMMAILNEKQCNINDLFPPENLSELIQKIDSGVISGKIAKDIFQEMVQTQKKPSIIIEKKGLTQISNEDEILPIVQKVIQENSETVESYKNGKDRALGFLVGQVMKFSKGKANPQLVNQLILKEINK